MKNIGDGSIVVMGEAKTIHLFFPLFACSQCIWGNLFQLNSNTLNEIQIPLKIDGMQIGVKDIDYDVGKKSL